MRLFPLPAGKADLHTHTSFGGGDGHNTPEEMVLSAIGKGLDRIGICAHAYVDFDDCCIPYEQYGPFRTECARLKEKYASQIEVLCGIEQDLYSPAPTDGFDYVLGSVHYLRVPDGYIPVDLSPEALLSAAEQYYGGDMLALAEAYYRAEAEVFAVTQCDIIAHFDLITKFNEGQKLFEETDVRYVAASRAAADVLLKSGRPFEINTGAISRGYRTAPYPSRALYDYIALQGGQFLLSSDAHRCDGITCEFDKWKKAYLL